MELSNYLEKNKGIKLTSQQQMVVNSLDGQFLVLACPGSGKTTSLCLRTGNLIFTHGIPADRILTMTFSRASARDMEDRFKTIFNDFISNNNINPKFSTIHSFAYSVVNRHYKYREMIEAKDATMNKTFLLKKIYRDIAKEYIEEDKYEELTTGISYIKNKMLNINELDEKTINEICNIGCFKEVFITYENYKLQNRLIDYDDMLTVCYEILLNNPSVLNFYREKYDYIQLDEAQDTSNVQFSIVSLLAAPKNNILYLADDDQSLYSWRASEVKYLLDFKDKYPDGTVYFMEHNFRSTKDIIELSNEFIKSNKERYDKNMFTHKENARPITVVELKDEKEELQYIVEQINKSEKYKDNAILYRNNLLSIPLINELYKNNIPFYIREQDNKFFTHWVLADILAFIKLSIDKNDFESFSRIYYKSNLFINKEMVYKSREYNDGCGCLNALLKMDSLTSKQKVNTLELISNLKDLEGAKGTQIANVVLNVLGYEKYLEKNAKRLGYSFENLSNILTAFKLITEDCENIESVFTKLATLRSLMKNSFYNRNKNVVTLTTIHGSKGLEFENVYVISMVEDIFPSKQSVIKLKEGDRALLEEERRLCYVAMTRGKTYVDLITLKNKNGTKAYPSMFIKEVNGLKGDNSLDLDTSSDSGDFVLGDVVYHKRFGEGTVMSVNIDLDVITVSFAHAGVKKLIYSLCLDGILKK